MAKHETTSRGVAWIWVLGFAVVVIAAVVAFAAARGSETSDLTSSAVTASGTALTSFSPDVAFDDPAVGKTIPALTGTNFDGAPVVVAPENGQPKVLVFLAHWCTICQQEVPEIVAWVDGGGSTVGVEVIAIATAVDKTRGNYPPGAWLERENWPFPTLMDSESSIAGAAYGVEGFPHFVAVDAQGEVVGRTSGNIGAAGFEKLLAAARSGTPTIVLPEGVTPPSAPPT